jgi:hypothetical protein
MHNYKLYMYLCFNKKYTVGVLYRTISYACSRIKQDIKKNLNV